MADFADILKALGKPFPPSEVKQRAAGFGNKKLDYVDWTAVVARCNMVHPRWGWSADVAYFTHMILDDPKNVGKSIVKFVAVVKGNLHIDGVVRTGVGADFDTDPDKVVKTALAEALKKAGNEFGIALELWDEAHRNNLAAVRDGDIETLKARVADLVPGFDDIPAKDKANAIRAAFNLLADADLNDPDVLMAILEKN